MLKLPRITLLLPHIPLAALCLALITIAPPSHNLAAQERGQSAKRHADSRPEPRIALVIGNAGYKESPLSNPVNDAQDVAAALQACGFEVSSGLNRTQRQMKDLIRQFGQKLRSGGVGVFYFAGHGVQVGGRNYLIPVDAEIKYESDVEDGAVDANFVLGQMDDARNRLNVVILDACRNNPYARGFRSGSRGLASISRPPSGTLISYATAADEVASDGTSGRNGLYTGELLAQLKTPGLTLEQVFRQTRSNVIAKSNGRQVPYEYTSVVGENFYFIPPNAPPPAISAEQQFWERVKQRRTPDAVRGFLSVYPDSPFEKEARALLAELEKSEKPLVISNPPAVSTPTALTPIIPLPRGVNPSALSIHRFTTASVDAKGKVTKFDGTPTQQYSEDLGDGVRLEMVAIKGGTFTMGAENGDGREKPPHQVKVNNFWIGKFELTQAQWRVVMGTNPSSFKGDDLPVENISWEDAKEFCRRLNAKFGLSGVEGYQLPSEAEWEYAARAGSKTNFAFGDTITAEIVNYGGDYPYGQAPIGPYRQETVIVGSLGIANAWRLFDLHGNVWEWCEDDWHSNYEGAPTDGSAWVEMSRMAVARVGRGGSWGVPAKGCLSAIRREGSSSNRSDLLGFRLVRIGR